MPRWTRGEAEVEQLIARGELERVTGAAADGTLLLEQASKTAATAAGLVSSDAYSAYILAYDSARFACIALLARQGLRATNNQRRSLRGRTGGPGSVRGRIPAVRGSPAAPQRAGIPAPAGRYSHVGGSRTGSRDSAEAYHRRRKAAAPIVLLQPRSGVTGPDHRRKPRHGIVRAMSPARYRKLVLPERAGSSGTACEPPTLPGSGTPVT